MLDVTGNTVNVTGFANRRRAAEELAKIESLGEAGVNAVLMWVNSINKLRIGYPNYYADTAAFLEALDFSLAKGNLQRINSELRKVSMRDATMRWLAS